MRKILDLTNKVLRTGRARSAFMDGGIWDSAIGMNPYIENDTYRGLIAATAAPTDLNTANSGVIVDTPFAYAVQESSTNILYMLGSGGHFYELSTASNTVTDLRSTTQINGPVAGMAIFQPRAATSATLLYARATNIGTWDMSSTYPTGWSDAAYTPGSTSAGAGEYRPFHHFADRLYYGDGPYVSMFSDDGTSTIKHTTKVLDIPGTYTVTALSDDSRYLVIGISHLSNSPNLFPIMQCQVLFWDKSRDSWDWEIPIPNESVIRAIKHVGNAVYVIGVNGVYTVSYGGSASKIYAFDPSESIYLDTDTFASYPSAAASFGDGIIFGNTLTALTKYLPGTDRIAYNPLTGITGNVTMVAPDFENNKIIVGTDDPHLYRFDLTSAGAASVQSWTTRKVPLGGYFHIQRMDITLPNGIGSSDHFYAYVYGDRGDTFVEVKQATYDGNTTYLSIHLPKQITTAHAKVMLNYVGGTPSISDISLWGEAANV